MIVNRQRGVRIPLKPLDLFLRRIRRQLRLGRAEISVAFVTNAEIARLNKLYRRKSGPTDVLSFPTRDGSRRSPGRWSPVADPFLGDIAIAPAVARKYARQHNRSLAAELRVLLLHGVLHLLGYDHEADRGQMDRLERKLRRRLELA